MTASSIVLAVSDQHTGSSTALAPAKFEIHTGRKDETQLVEASRAQKWLLACWMDLVDYAKTLAGIRGKYRKKRLILFYLGDTVDGLHHGTVQVMNEAQDQIEAACNIHRPVVAIADAAFLTYGTPAHNGGTGEFERTIGDELGMRHAWEFSLSIDGVGFDLMHVGRAGRRDWTSSAPGLAAEVASDYISDGKLPPRYVLRGHVHKIDDSGLKLPYTRAIMLPSWQLRTAYGHQVTNQKRADIGGLIIDTEYPDMPILNRMRYKAPGGFIHTETV